MPDRHWTLKQNEGSGEWLDAAAAGNGEDIDNFRNARLENVF